MQGSTLVLIAASLALLLLAIVGRSAGRSRRRRDARRRALLAQAGRALFFSRRLNSLAARWAATGYEGAALLICGMTGPMLPEGWKRRVEMEDADLGAEIDRERALNAGLALHCRKRISKHEWPIPPNWPEIRRAFRVPYLRCLLETAEADRRSGDGMFALGDPVKARGMYLSTRAKLNEAWNVAKEAKSRFYSDLALSRLVDLQEGLDACDSWILNDYTFSMTDTGLSLVLERRSRTGRRCALGTIYVKGIISPYFRREDGTAAPHPA